MSNKICILWPEELPDDLTEATVVVIDVFAATTNIPYLLSQDIGSLILVNSEILADIKSRYPDSLLIGESSNKAIKFDATNNPYYIRKAEITGRNILYMTNNGTRIIQMVFDKKAGDVFTAGFVNLGATAEILKSERGKDIILVPAGEYQLPKWGYKNDHALEDYMCAKVLLSLFKNEKPEIEKSIAKAKKFIFDYYPARDTRVRDVDIIFQLNSFNLVPECLLGEDYLINIVKSK